jgi:hypothetical protein
MKTTTTSTIEAHTKQPRVRISLSLASNTIEAVDRVAAEKNINRSRAVETLVVQALQPQKVIAMAQRIAENPLPEGLEPFAVAYDFDGYGHRYADNGDGGNYAAKMLEPDTIPLYTPERMTEIFERALSHVERGTEPRTNHQPTKI